ncbi:MAG: hypothetical protein GX610_01280 [Rhodococcus sp.]|nr:hypothetical protein [Rhodococcus sp. (in: high G+C Gram-positive bacteria)]
MYWADQLVLVGTEQAEPPQQLDVKPLIPKTTDGTNWSAWMITLPTRATGSVSSWLSQFGIAVEERRSRTRILTPAVEYGPDGTPHFYLGDPLAVIPSKQATAMVAESHATISATQLERRAPTSTTAYAVTAIETGTVYLRTDAKRDIIRFEVVNESSVPMDDFTPVWSVLYGDNRILPFTTHHANSRTTPVKIVSEIHHLRFQATAHHSSGRKDQLQSGSALDVADWLAAHSATAESLTIDAGNLGHVRIELPESPTSHTDEANVEFPARLTWETTYAIAADSASDPTVPHWRVRKQDASPKRRKGPFMLVEW